MTKHILLGAYIGTLHLLWLVSALRSERLVDWVCKIHVPIVRACYSRLDTMCPTIIWGDRIRKYWERA